MPTDVVRQSALRAAVLLCSQKPELVARALNIPVEEAARKTFGPRDEDDTAGSR